MCWISAGEWLKTQPPIPEGYLFRDLYGDESYEACLRWGLCRPSVERHRWNTSVLDDPAYASVSG